MNFLFARFGSKELVNEMIDSMPKSIRISDLIRSADAEVLGGTDIIGKLTEIRDQNDSSPKDSTILVKSGADRLERIIRQRIRAKELSRAILEFMGRK